MDTAGIDLAAQDAKTAVCRITWGGHTASVAPPLGGADGITEDALVEAVGRGNWVGIDSPFGWPASFVQAVSGYAEREPWPDVDADTLRYRLTDRRVRKELKLSPLSVSSDRIGVTAWRCARLVTLARAGRKAADRTGRDRIVEVYPRAALMRWGLNPRGYKTSGNSERKRGQRAKREALLSELERSADWLRWEGDARDRCIESDDCLDAFTCALIARAAAVGLTGWPKKKKEWRAARAEGWIHLPAADSLPELLRASEKRPPSKP
jgi:predicted nuclease with RNAse H fold